MQTVFTTEPLPEHLKDYYERKLSAMTADEQKAYYEKRRNSIANWTKPLTVETVVAGDSSEDYGVYDDVLSSISLVSNMWVKQMLFENAGDVHPGHAHTFDHQTLLGAGKLEVWANGQTTEYEAPTIIYIKAGIRHGMRALSDKTVVYCIHPLRDGERVEDIIDPKNIPNGVWPLVEHQEKKLRSVETV
jgi:quercetin dioxygenase-like cupin family protein